MSFKDLEQKHNLVNMVILACGKHPTDADVNPLLEERLERFYEDAVIEGMAKQMHSSVDRAVNAMVKPEQEPVAWLHPDKKVDVVVPTSLTWFDKLLPLYTAPPRKPWVSLTDEEMPTLTTGTGPITMLPFRETKAFIRAIEAKLKEKNT